MKQRRAEPDFERGLRPAAVELRYRVWTAQPRRGMNVNSRGCNPRADETIRYRPRRGRTRHEHGICSTLSGSRPVFRPSPWVAPTATHIHPRWGWECGHTLNSMVVELGRGNSLRAC